MKTEKEAPCHERSHRLLKLPDHLSPFNNFRWNIGKRIFTSSILEWTGWKFNSAVGVEIVDKNRRSLQKMSHNKIKQNQIKPRTDQEPRKLSTLDVDNFVILGSLALLFLTKTNSLFHEKKPM